MRMTVELFALQGRRVGCVIDYVGTHLDEDISLARLADLACLSPSQLERLYRSKVGETPLASLRRLRLNRAIGQIRAGQGDLQDIALAAGYASGAAFTHAFVRQFGFAPSRTPALSPYPPALPPLYLEHLAEQPVFQVAYQGALRDTGHACGQLVGSLAVGGAKRWRKWVALDPDRPLCAGGADRVELTHFVPVLGQPQQIAGVDRATHAAGLYAVWHTLGYPSAAALPGVIEEIRARLQCVWRADARILLREINVSGYTAPQERRYALYIPVAPLKRRS